MSKSKKKKGEKTTCKPVAFRCYVCSHLLNRDDITDTRFQGVCWISGKKIDLVRK